MDPIITLRQNETIMKNELHQQTNQMKVKQGTTPRSCRMTEKLGMHLEELGFTWRRIETSWDEHFQELCSFQLRHGHCNVPYSPRQQSAKMLSLASWVRQQRHEYRHLLDKQFQHPGNQHNKNWSYRSVSNKNRLTPERVSKLNRIGFAWRERSLTARSA